MCAVGGSLYGVQDNLAAPTSRYFTLLGSITFLLIMVLGGAATLWGPIFGAVAYVAIDARTREAGASGEGIIGMDLRDWVERTPGDVHPGRHPARRRSSSPRSASSACCRRIARYFVVIVPATSRYPAASGPRQRGAGRGRGGTGVLTGADITAHTVRAPTDTPGGRP